MQMRVLQTHLTQKAFISKMTKTIFFVLIGVDNCELRMSFDFEITNRSEVERVIRKQHGSHKEAVFGIHKLDVPGGACAVRTISGLIFEKFRILVLTY